MVFSTEWYLENEHPRGMFGRSHRESTKKKMSQSHIGKHKEPMPESGKEKLRQYTREKSSGWKGGYRNKDGYRMILIGTNKYRGEHRLIAEKALERELKPTEFVHHVNGIRDDNRNKNLIICDGKYHKWLHEYMAQLYIKEHFGGY